MQHTDWDAQPFQSGERSLIDECPMLRHLAGGPFIEHHLTVDRFIQRFPVLQRQQDRGKAVFAEGAGRNMQGVLLFF